MFARTSKKTNAIKKKGNLIYIKKCVFLDFDPLFFFNKNVRENITSYSKKENDIW